MGQIDVEIHEGSEAADSTEQVIQLERFPYRVLAEAGIFKNGKQYNMGETVQLDRRTAQSFIEIGEVEEA